MAGGGAPALVGHHIRPVDTPALGIDEKVSAVSAHENGVDKGCRIIMESLKFNNIDALYMNSLI